MYTCLAFNAAVAIYALVRLLTDPRSARPIGSQFREYLQAWRTLPAAEPTQARFHYRDLDPRSKRMASLDHAPSLVAPRGHRD